MNRTLAITAIALVAVVMIVGAIIPAMAVSASGIIHSINPSEKHGVIVRTDDGSGTLYQFRIPQDTGGFTPDLGQAVGFIIDPENSRHVTAVCFPPNTLSCGGGD